MRETPLSETPLSPPKLPDTPVEMLENPSNETARSRLPGIIFILVGVFLMALASLTATPAGASAPDETRGEPREDISNLSNLSNSSERSGGISIGAGDAFIGVKYGAGEYVGRCDDDGAAGLASLVVSGLSAFGCETIFRG